MGPADLKRYRELLLDKRRELSSARGDPRAPVPAAGVSLAEILCGLNAFEISDNQEDEAGTANEGSGM